MAWRYPPHVVKPTRVVEMEDLNENFQVYVEEASGHLNAHNFASGIFTSNRTRLAEDIGVRLYRNSQVSDSVPVPPLNAFSLELTGNDNWLPIPDMSLTVISQGFLSNENIIGLYGERLGVCVEEIVSLLPGTYVIRPVYFLPVRTKAGADPIYINNREIIIIETVR